MIVRVEVAGPQPYPVLIGSGAIEELANLIPAGATRALLVHGPQSGGLAGRARDLLAGAGLATTMFEVPDGEAAKDVSILTRGWELAAAGGLTRSDIVVGLGGGSVSDLAGFIAATWLRGVGVIHVPTTLLGMVDAAIGGKTGINTAAGKNLVGAFHPPLAVLSDLAALATLPQAEVRSGLAEVAKCGFIADPVILRLLAELPDVREARGEVLGPISGSLAASPDTAQTLIERAARVKAEVVSVDLKESGPREALNYGHTLGHAIEKAEGYRMRHGEAIAIGMVFAAELAVAAGRAQADLTAETRRVLERLGLPVRYAGASLEELVATMRLDKKSRGAALRFVIVPAPGRTEIVWDPPAPWLHRAATAISLPT